MKSFICVILLFTSFSFVSSSPKPTQVVKIDAKAQYEQDFIEKKIEIADNNITAKYNEVLKENKVLSKNLQKTASDLDVITNKLEDRRNVRRLKRELRKEARLAESQE